MININWCHVSLALKIFWHKKAHYIFFNKWNNDIIFFRRLVFLHETNEHHWHDAVKPRNFKTIITAKAYKHHANYSLDYWVVPWQSCTWGCWEWETWPAGIPSHCLWAGVRGPCHLHVFALPPLVCRDWRPGEADPCLPARCCSTKAAGRWALSVYHWDEW